MQFTRSLLRTFPLSGVGSFSLGGMKVRNLSWKSRKKFSIILSFKNENNKQKTGKSQKFY